MIYALLCMCLLLPPQSAELPVPPEALPLLQSGIDAENRGALDQAVAAFRKAADLAPDSAIVLLRLGDAYMKKRDYAAAIPPLKHAAELSPDSPAVHQLLGYALLATGYAAEAIPHLKMINDAGALGLAQLQAGQAAEAVANLQAALAKAPDEPDLLFYLSRASTALAGQSLDRLRAVDPNSARGHQALGQTEYEMKKLPEAAKEYEQAIAMRPDLPGLRLELGQGGRTIPRRNKIAARKCGSCLSFGKCVAAAGKDEGSHCGTQAFRCTQPRYAGNFIRLGQ